MGSESKAGDLEWLVTDGTGAFAMGCVDQTPRRKYHSLLSIADGLIEGGGKNLVARVDEQVVVGENTKRLSGQAGVFRSAPWPEWSWSFPHAGEGAGGATIEASRRIEPLRHCCRFYMESGFRVSYRFTRRPGRGDATQRRASALKRAAEIRIEPGLLSRPIHALTEKNAALQGMPRIKGKNVWDFRLYPDEPLIVFSWVGASVEFVPAGRWERVEHEWEAQRGYGSREDVFVPGAFVIAWEGDAELRFGLLVGSCQSRSARTENGDGDICVPTGGKPQLACRCGEDEGSRPSVAPSRLARLAFKLRPAVTAFAADLDEEEEGRSPTLLAGLPWFGPWARDLFVCVPGYALALGCSELPYLLMASAGRRLLLRYSALDRHRDRALNTLGADVPWLYAWALEKLVSQGSISPKQERVLVELGVELAEAVLAGKQDHVRAEPQGGLRVESGPWALTWMDAVIDGTPVTPRDGFPIEVNALYLNGLGFYLERMEPSYRPLTAGRLKEAYEATLNRPLEWEPRIRPNDLWALALPRVKVPREKALLLLQTIRAHLLTPVGLRTLSPGDRAYHGQCVGDQRSRDQAYHQGTVWPWLLGIYGDAVLRWEGRTALAADLAPVWDRLERHLVAEGCIGQVSEIFDGDPPHLARGAPAQAWSACELYRLLVRMQQQQEERGG